MGLLDEPVLTLWLEKLPISRAEWLRVIPQDVRREIDGKQASNPFEQVLDLVDRITL